MFVWALIGPFQHFNMIRDCSKSEPLVLGNLNNHSQRIGQLTSSIFPGTLTNFIVPAEETPPFPLAMMGSE